MIENNTLRQRIRDLEKQIVSQEAAVFAATCSTPVLRPALVAGSPSDNQIQQQQAPSHNVQQRQQVQLSPVAGHKHRQLHHHHHHQQHMQIIAVSC
ncbi:unnamed protein product [Protopolystoma xenopodis]|uniref:Uncharacterized protein n=1 Tax=Protopolystoma xenopodis TaxID=117903 RepID=A0A3S5A9I5_9PLAT|nr:unnamed protein product [Protopolystoma xenopodis]